MHIFIAGICGTFMGGLAQLAKAAGHKVTGCDAQVYPPMSTQLQSAGIEVGSGFDPAYLNPAPDMVIIGNALSRGNEMVEYILNEGLPYTSGPQWFAEHILRDKWVLGVSGTHGKTSASSMLAWVLEYAGKQPGFLIGGVPENFGVSARLGESDFFVVEADEYDTAFFDKRSKFIHYRPKTLVINNLEFDHADIFKDLNAIQTQFHHVVRCVPQNGQIITPFDDENVNQTLKMGCWSEHVCVGSRQGLHARNLSDDGSAFDVYEGEEHLGRLDWDLLGEHNVHNALVVLASAKHAGVSVEMGIQGLSRFKNVKRRMEVKGYVNGITVYDDFAHHPTAINTTLAGLRKKVSDERIIAVLEPRSNTMRMGVHAHTLIPSLEQADRVYLYLPPDLTWQLEPNALKGQDHRIFVLHDLDALVTAVTGQAQQGDHILVMSNGGFGGIHDKLLKALAQSS